MPLQAQRAQLPAQGVQLEEISSQELDERSAEGGEGPSRRPTARDEREEPEHGGDGAPAGLQALARRRRQARTLR